MSSPESEPITPEELAGMDKFACACGINGVSMEQHDPKAYRDCVVTRLIREVERLCGENAGLLAAAQSLEDTVYAMNDREEPR